MRSAICRDLGTAALAGSANGHNSALFRIADLAGFVDLLVGQPVEIAHVREALLLWKSFRVLAILGDFASLLRCVVLVREPPFGLAFDQKRIGLGAFAPFHTFSKLAASRAKAPNRSHGG